MKKLISLVIAAAISAVVAVKVQKSKETSNCKEAFRASIEQQHGPVPPQFESAVQQSIQETCKIVLGF